MTEQEPRRRAMRIATDVGGTFTDLVIEDGAGRRSLFKSLTTPDDPVRGVFNALGLAATDAGLSVEDLLGQTSLFIHGTTRATNAIIVGDRARTAFLTTQGHPNVLLWREGGKMGTFDHSQWFPEAYVSSALTWEVPERIGAGGEVVKPLDEDAVLRMIEELRAADVEAVAVCLLWSIMNGAHEARLGELLREHLPGIPITLSHEISPTVREYRRASAAAIDASLKPLMSDYLNRLSDGLNDAGFRGRTLVMTSVGGVLDAHDVARAPIHTVGSGPAAAPVAGRHFAQIDAGTDTVIVTDAGGTSYDVSLVRRGTIPTTRDAKLGRSFNGQITGFPSVDVKSIGAGGGSIAYVDSGGMLHVGPQSAGADPGPACYGRGGDHATVTDASLVLGYLDAGFFLGGAMQLDVEAAHRVVSEHVAKPLGISEHEAASAILQLATEHMVSAIEEITLNQGVDPRSAVCVAGGGSAGFYAVSIARRLNSPKVIVPQASAALSAVGALLSDLTAEYATMFPAASRAFDLDGVNKVLASLRESCEQFAANAGEDAGEPEIRFAVEARYPDQVWDLEVPLRAGSFSTPEDVKALEEDFHAVHQEIYAIADQGSPIEGVTWKAYVRCALDRSEGEQSSQEGATVAPAAHRAAYFPSTGLVEVPVHLLHQLEPGVEIAGPAIVESPVTTIVLDPGSKASRSTNGSLVIDPVATTDTATDANDRLGATR